MRVRALGLISGGLDSMLAVRLLQDQGIEMTGIAFQTPFFGPESARNAAIQMGIPLRVVDIGASHLKMLRSPRYGYGRQMNPCIDCHALMLQTAGQIMEAEGFDFLATGEVVGQRPMSQRRDALVSVDKLSGYAGYILRPLSAGLLPVTIPERQGKVDRQRLLRISGRSRKQQMALAVHYGIHDYPSPAGGCLLTNPGFAARLRDLFSTQGNVDLRDVELLKQGRHLRLPQGSRVVVGRIHADNVRLRELARPEDIIMKVDEVPGPTALLPGGATAADVEVAAAVVAAYSDAATGTEASIAVSMGQTTRIMTVVVRPKEEYREMLI
jgi:tRNA U34 2-thiouridine synthase MnmA/TrmU